jgi:HD-GYP domain-containing protein (c-di-GMP phosphodiesterase class II)
MADDTMTDEATEQETAPDPDVPTPEDGADRTSASDPTLGRVVMALWLPTPVRRRLIDLDVELVDDIADGPELILASSRGPAARRPSIAALAEHAPVVVVCHPGGEAMAADLVRYGALTVVAEGAESAALRVLDEVESTHLVDAYASEVDRNWSGSSALTIDPVTKLPTTSGFELTLAEIGKDGTVPRLGLVKLGLENAEKAIGTTATQALKRRLVTAVAGAASHAGAEVFDLGGMLAFVAPSMTLAVATALGHEIIDIGAAYAPTGEPLEVAVGIAGNETAADIDSLRLLADRALKVAESRERSVVDADELSKHSAAAVELGAAMAVADAVDDLDPRGGHSQRMADYVAEISRELQLDQVELSTIGLAARLHDIGKLHFGADAFDEASPNHAQAAVEHCRRGEQYLQTNAGAEVAKIVRSHHERWDGTGFPDGLDGPDIPLGARILAVAHVYDDLVAADATGAEIETGLREAAGVSLDPDVVEAAIALFARG